MKEYYKDTNEVIKEQGSSIDGLSFAEAAKRLEQYGMNKLSEGKKKGLPVKLLEQLKDPMIIILVVAAVLSGVFSEFADMCIILVVVIVNAVLGIVQESKAEKAIEALQRMSAPYSRIRRDNVICRVKSDEIVPGDIILLEAGDFVPADIRIIEAAALKIEEAALTGESVAVDKTSDTLIDEDMDIPLGDRMNMAYMGTSISYGRGEGIVTRTGMNTEMGKIARILAETDTEKTPLQVKLANLSKVLSILVLGICIFIFLFSVIKNGGFSGGHVFEMLLTSISLAVAAIPEGLVVVVTVLLSIGVTKMSKQNAIIRKLTAVETLGCTQIICSDKTGTLTQNKMTVTALYGEKEILAEVMALCSDVGVDPNGEFIGESTELALVRYAKSIGLNKPDLEKKSPRTAEAPFDSVRKMMTTIHACEDGSYIQYTKGAPDEVLRCCSKMLHNGEIVDITNVLTEQILNENKNMADKALRVLAGAVRYLKEVPEDLTPSNIEKDMIFIGLAGMIDPIRKEVKAAIEKCKNAGIRPVMITGDHKDTAIAIARELGIITHNNQAISGAELSLLGDDEFNNMIENISVYARVQPEHKVRIVNTWRKKGKVTAMTGDGVNDAPALKNADIGIGMGITGTDVTKNVADLVLADDNFATVVYAVEEGRRIYENIRKAIQFLLSSNLSEVVAIFIATLASVKLFAPIHILWINLITDTMPAMALGMEKSEADSMNKLPRDSKEGIFSNGLGIGIIYQGVLIAAATLVSFFIGNKGSHETGMTMAFLTLSMCEVFHSLNMRSRTKSIFKVKSHNKFLFGAMIIATVFTVLVIYVPGLNGLFRLTALSIKNCAIAVGLAFSIVPIVEVVKFITSRFSKR